MNASISETEPTVWPEWEGGSEEPESSPDAPEPFAEMGPHWEKALKEWGLWWDFHVYFLAVLHVIVVVFGLTGFIFVSTTKMQSKWYFMALNGLISFMGITRLLDMCIDPYNHKGILEPYASWFLMGITLPCLTTSYYLLCSAIMKATQLKHVSQKIYSPKAIIIVISINFTLFILADVLSAIFITSARVLISTCQAFFILISIALSLTFVFLFKRLYNGSIAIRQQLRTSLRRVVSLAAAPVSIPKTIHTTKRILFSVKLILIASILYIFIAIINAYALITSITTTGEYIDSWSWWAVTFLARSCEGGLAIIICVAATRPITLEKIKCCKARRVEPSKKNSKISLLASVSNSTIENFPPYNKNHIEKNEDKNSKIQDIFTTSSLSAKKFETVDHITTLDSTLQINDEQTRALGVEKFLIINVNRKLSVDNNSELHEPPLGSTSSLNVLSEVEIHNNGRRASKGGLLEYKVIVPFPYIKTTRES